MKLFTTSSRIQSQLGFLILVSLFIGFLCISFIHNTNVESHMGHKIFQVTLNPCCDSEVNNHMELWKSTLVGIPQSFQDILTLIVIGVAAAFVFLDFFAIPKLNVNVFTLRYKQYAREHPNVSIYNPLKLAFTRGILHPKTY